MIAIRPFILACAVSVLAHNAAQGATLTWNNAGDDWFDAANWDNGGVPGVGDTAVINSGTVALSNDTANLGSLTMGGGTLTFTNWGTTLSATSVSINNGATVSAFGPFTDSAMSNRVYVSCSNLTVASGGAINVDGKGWEGGDIGVSASGPGAGANHSSSPAGGGYGGRGGGGSGGVTYGSTNAPLDPGSGGGGRSPSSGPGGHGGGAIRIDATGDVTVHGTITANGTAGGGRGGDASGGGIFISCRRFLGTGGSITAEARAAAGAGEGHGGGGGRIAVVYDVVAQAGAATHTVHISTHRSNAQGGGSSGSPGSRGTLYFPDARILNGGSFVSQIGVLVIPGFTSLDVDAMLITNSYLFVPSDARFALTVSNDLTVIDGKDTPNNLLTDVVSTGGIEFESVALTCLGNISITNSASLTVGQDSTLHTQQLVTCSGSIAISDESELYVYAASTNGGYADGARVDVTGDILISGADAWIYPGVFHTNGASVTFTARDLKVLSTTSGINADGLGWRGGGPTTDGFSKNGYGPGGGLTGSGESASGGGYGGAGGPGSGQATVGATYGPTNAPIHAGGGGGCRNSGAANNRGGNGGGLVFVEASREVVMNGTISANGINGSQAAGGAGGGIFLIAPTFSGGASAVMRANGGNGHTGPPNYGGGGGGRIAVWLGEVRSADRAVLLTGSEAIPGGTLITTNAYAGYAGTNIVEKGTGWAGGLADDGTALFLSIDYPPAGTLIWMR